MKILVTGAGGLIGNWLVHDFAKAGHPVFALYRNTVPKVDEWASKRVQLVRHDLAEPLDALPPVDAIIHAAAHTHLIPGSTARDYIRANVLGGLNLADYAIRVRPRVLVNLSTISLYGQVGQTLLNEEAPLWRPELYGASKYMAELALEERSGDFPSVSVRMPGVVGPNYFTPWIGKVLRCALRNDPISIYNPAAPFNNVLDLEEVARFASLLLERQHEGYEVVNLGASEPLTVRQTVELLIAEAGSNSTIIVRPPSGVSFYIDIAKVVMRYGYSPSPTRDIVTRYVRANRVPLSSISCTETPF